MEVINHVEVRKVSLLSFLSTLVPARGVPLPEQIGQDARLCGSLDFRLLLLQALHRLASSLLGGLALLIGVVGLRQLQAKGAETEEAPAGPLSLS